MFRCGIADSPHRRPFVPSTSTPDEGPEHEAYSVRPGASAVEFALVIMPLVLLLMGIIDFGTAYNQQLELSSAAREGVGFWRCRRTLTPLRARELLRRPREPSRHDHDLCPGGSLPPEWPARRRIWSPSPHYPLESSTGFFDFLLEGKTLTGTGAMKCGG